jgi:outer membrane protein assembly factor BamD
MTIGSMRRYLYRGAVLLLAAGAAGCGSGGAGALRSTVTAESLLQRARERFRQGDFRNARALFERAAFEYPPGHPQLAEARYFLGESLFQMGSYVAAAVEYRRVAEEHATSPYAPLALLRAGDAHLRQWTHPELDPSAGQTALAFYQELAGRYPGTDAAARAQLHVRQLREWFAEKAYRIGMFYVRRKAWDSAILYFKEIVANFADLDRASDALLRLVDVYDAIKYREERRETCEHLRRYYPQVEGLADACPEAAGGR